MTYINSGSMPELSWASRLGAFSLRPVGLPGISLPAAVTGTGTSTAATQVPAATHALPRVRGKVAFVAPPTQQDSVQPLLGQTNTHNYMTRAYAVGEGASGPPPSREPV